MPTTDAPEWAIVYAVLAWLAVGLAWVVVWA